MFLTMRNLCIRVAVGSKMVKWVLKTFKELNILIMGSNPYELLKKRFSINLFIYKLRMKGKILKLSNFLIGKFRVCYQISSFEITILAHFRKHPIFYIKTRKRFSEIWVVKFLDIFDWGMIILKFSYCFPSTIWRSLQCEPAFIKITISSRIGKGIRQSCKLTVSFLDLDLLSTPSSHSHWPAGSSPSMAQRLVFRATSWSFVRFLSIV